MRCRAPIMIVVIVSSLLRVAHGAAVELVPGVPVERDLGGGDIHEYRLTLTAGQYAHVVVHQRGIDLQLAVFAPDDQRLISIDSVTDTAGPEPVSVLADASGSYRLEVSAVHKEAVGGRYEVQLDELRPFRAEDRTRMEAQEVFAEGRKLQMQGTAGSNARSIELFEKALGLWKACGDRWYEAVTWSEIGTVTYLTGRPQLAADKWTQALVAWQTLGDSRGEAEALNNLGAAYENLADFRHALEFLGQSLAMNHTSGDAFGEATTLGNIGKIHWNMGEYKEALDYTARARDLAHAIGDREREIYGLQSVGRVYFSLGENQLALEQFARALELLRYSSNRHDLLSAINLNLTGDVYARLGDAGQAFNYYRQALPLSQAAGDRIGEASTLQNIGIVDRIMGNPRQALEYFDRALSIARASGRRELEATTLTEIGAAHADLGDKASALRFYSQALQMHAMNARPESEIRVLTQAGPLYAETGDREKAVACLDQALTLSRSIRYRPGEALALLGRARLARNRAMFDGARSDLEAALPIVESARKDLDRWDLRAAFLASQRSYYELYIDVLMQVHQPGAAFEISERARARGLLETLAEAHADIRQGADPELLERERALRQQLNARERYRTDLLGRKDRAEQVAMIERELNGLVLEYQDVQARIRVSSPRYAALTLPQPLALGDLQQRVLDEDTLLLEYALGADRSYVWAVTSASIESFELPRRAEIETAAARAYELLKGSPKREFQRQTELALDRVSRMILAPVAGRLAHKRLAIVSEGALQYLPFEALPVPGALKPGSGHPLVADHEVVNLPSASVLAVLRQEVAGRTPAPKTVAVLSDPVFETRDPRVRKAQTRLAKTMAPGAEGKGETDQTALTRSAGEAGVVRFERLPFSRREADSIEDLASPGEVLKAVDFAASRRTALSPEMSQFRIVHFATHGLINSQHPELSGIVLSLVDEQGQSQDGFLRAHEIYNLNLPAELVVLSACQTALGKEIKGEGLLGLTRGFMYAGAPRVLASLWDVKDEATAELMNRFYRAMLKEHLRPAAALRAAQISMLREARWKAPYYWAAFVIQGEWR
jgi:CHAT domain-containing protein/predicted negative regulator of RcsB-dependent stress response